jgi:hypothetical protein
MSERKKPRVELISLNPFTVRSMQMEADRLVQHENATHEANALQTVLRALHGVVGDLPQTQTRTDVLKWIADTTAKWTKAADQSRKLADPVQSREVVQAVLREFCQKNPEVEWGSLDRTLVPSEAKCVELAGKPGLGPVAVEFLRQLHSSLHEFDPSLTVAKPQPFNRVLDLEGVDAEDLARKYGAQVLEKVRTSLPWQVCFRRPDAKKKNVEPEGRLVEVTISPTRHVLDFQFVYMPTMERCSFERYQTLARANPLPSRDPSDLSDSPLSLFVKRKPEHEWARLSGLIDPAVAEFREEEAIEYFIGHSWL